MIEAPMALPRYVNSDLDRHGNPRLYYRKGKGKRIRLSVMPGHPEWEAALEAAKIGRKWLPGKGLAVEPRSASTGTLRALVRDFYRSPYFLGLDLTTQRKRRGVLDGCLDERIHPARPELMGECPVEAFNSDHVQTMRARKASAPEAANARVKAIRRLFNWAIGDKRPLVNPVGGDVRVIASATGGHHTWTLAEVEQFWERHPLGTKPRLVMDLLLFTGLRISDIVRLGRPHLRNGEIQIDQWKGRKKERKVLIFPLLPEAKASIEARPGKGLTFIQTDEQKPRPHSAKGLGNRIREWCDAAGLPHCSAHGLRKAGATFAAENGATAHQLMAIFGWSRIEQAEVYTKKADKRRMAHAGMHLLAPTPAANKSKRTAK